MINYTKQRKKEVYNAFNYFFQRKYNDRAKKIKCKTFQMKKMFQTLESLKTRLVDVSKLLLVTSV